MTEGSHIGFIHSPKRRSLLNCQQTAAQEPEEKAPAAANHGVIQTKRNIPRQTSEDATHDTPRKHPNECAEHATSQ